MEIKLTSVQEQYIAEYFKAKEENKPLPIWYGGSASGKTYIMQVIKFIEDNPLIQ